MQRLGDKVLTQALIRKYCTVFSVALIVAAVAGPVNSIAQEAPGIAIGNPRVAETIPHSVRGHLDLNQIVDELEKSLQATRKFAVLTRDKQNLGAILDEQERSGSAFFSGNAATTGALQNADLLVVPVIQEFVFYRSAKAVPNIDGKWRIQDSGRLVVNLQVLDTTSGMLKSSFALKDSFATKERLANSSGGSPSRSHFTGMAKSVAAKFADQLIDSVFPMLVIRADGNQVWINRGNDGGLKNGDVLNAYNSAGERLVDPYTGEVLGESETYAGKIRIVRVNPKFSIAEVQSTSDGQTVKQGTILRKP